MGERIHAQLFELWIEPELARRGGLDRDEVRRAAVLMTDPPTVLLNDEVQVVASVRATRSIQAGEAVTESDFDEVRGAHPVGIDPNLGWILYVVVGAAAIVSFDLRANRATAEQMLVLASDHLAAANSELAAGRPGPSIDGALAAAELAVKAETLLLGQTGIRHHHERLEFWSNWVRLGNAPSHLSGTFARLTAERPAARYGDRPISMSAQDISAAILEVSEMIDLARARSAKAGQPRDQ